MNINTSLKWVTVELDDERKFQFLLICDDPAKAKEYMERMLRESKSSKRLTIAAGSVGSDEVE